MTTRFLTLDELLLLCERFGYGPVADAGLLASAAARPVTTVMGADAYETVAEKAASMLESVSTNHALVDGNKRLALHSTVTFLRLNGFDLDLDDAGRYQLAYDVADGTVRGVHEIAARMTLCAWPRGDDPPLG